MTEKSPTIEKQGGVTCIRLGPEFENLDEYTLDMIRTQLLEAAAAADPPRVLIDLQYTSFFGSSFIEVLFRIWNRINAIPGGKFGISGLTDYCKEVLEVTHLDKLWELYPTFEEAVRELSDG
ncbi:MAG: STAS domain-containing protein [Rhodopirellula sp.]|nr:STAS domain-containing protein [Rhodopirellula sp.]